MSQGDDASGRPRIDFNLPGFLKYVGRNGVKKTVKRTLKDLGLLTYNMLLEQARKRPC